MKARTSGASEPRERSGAWGPCERPPAPRLRRGLAVALTAEAEACRGDRRGEAPRTSADKSSFGKARAAITTALAVMIGGSSSVLACPMCFGATDTSMIGGTKLGVLVMVAVTLAVQAAFVAFFLYLRKHAKQIRDLELDSEWSELQRASRS
jgi:hypothetical protein